MNITVRNIPDEVVQKIKTLSQKSQNNHIVDEFILSIPILDPDLDILKKFAELKACLKSKRQLLPDADIFIASTALIKCSKLITGNTKHFYILIIN